MTMNSHKISLFLNIFLRKWWSFVSIPYNFFNITFSLLLLKFSYEVTIISATIATKSASNEVTDFIFLNFPRIDTSFIHGTLSFFLYDLRIPLFLIFIRYTPFAAKVLSCIILLRALTINLTHLGMPDGIVPVHSAMTFGGDLFFSGHVANIFILGLVFWNIKILRYFFMSMSVIFGISAVLGHYHYSIDVISAPFFAYGVFVICKKIFKKDYANTTV